MQVTVIDGCGYYDDYANQLRQCLIDSFKSEVYNFEIVSIEKYFIKPCVGCLNCWFKTPGKCIFKDDMETVLKALINCDILILLGDIAFGGFSSTLKTALDRSVSLFVPFLTNKKGTSHYQLRYPPKRGIAYLGILKDEHYPSLEDTFIRLTNKMSSDFASDSNVSLVIHQDIKPYEECLRIKKVLHEGLLCKL